MISHSKKLIESAQESSIHASQKYLNEIKYPPAQNTQALTPFRKDRPLAFDILTLNHINILTAIITTKILRRQLPDLESERVQSILGREYTELNKWARRDLIASHCFLKQEKEDFTPGL